MADTTTVFQSGNSQAVRLPKEFRFKSKTVEIFRRGNEVVLREKPRTLGELLDSLPPITPEIAADIERVFSNVRDTSPPQERDWAALWGEARPASASTVGKATRKVPPAKKQITGPANVVAPKRK
jgi:antitoxin VapB